MAHRDHRPSAWRARQSRDDDGFTLIELLVVITILGILAGVVVFAVQGIGDKGRANAIATDASVLRTAEEAHCAQHGSYATLQELKAARLLSSRATYNTVALGSGESCGKGLKSSFTVEQNVLPTDFLPGKSAIELGGTTTEPLDVDVDPGLNRVYVTNRGATSVSVLDGDSDAVLGTIDVGSTPARLVVNPANHKVYVANTASASVSVIDGAATGAGAACSIVTSQSCGKVIAVPATGTPPTVLAVNPANNDVYVAMSSGGIRIVNGGDDSVSPAIAIAMKNVSANSPAATFAFDTEANLAYVVGTNDRLIAIDGAARALAAAQPPAPPLIQPFNNGTPCIALSAALAVDPQGHRVFFGGTCGTASNIAAASLVYHATTGTYTSVQAPVNQDPTAWAQARFNPNTNQAFFVGGEPVTGAVMRRLDVASDRLDGQARMKFQVNAAVNTRAVYKGFALNPSTNRLYWAQGTDANSGSNGGITVVDGNTMLSSTFGEGRIFTAIAVNPVTNKVYAVERLNHKLAVLK